MIRHLLVSLFRNIRKNAFSFSVKASTLVISLACVTLLTIYITDELSFDRHHIDSNRIFRITTSSVSAGRESNFSRTPIPLAEQLAVAGSVDQSARVFERAATVSVPDTEIKISEPHTWFADKSIFEIFSFSIRHGSLNTFTGKGSGIVITRENALKYFQTENAVGKTLLIENKIIYEVVAVVEQFPETSSFPFDIIVPFEQLFNFENPGNVEYLKTDWIYTSVFTFVKLKPNTSPEDLRRDLVTVAKLSPNERIRSNVNYLPQPLQEVHLYSSFDGESSQARINYIYIFSAITLALLLIAVVNYVTLTTAEWRTREKEFVIRSILGSSRHGITINFILETIFFTITLLPVVLFASYLLLPFFNQITSKVFSFAHILSLPVAVATILTTLLYAIGTAAFLRVKFRLQHSSLISSLKSSRKSFTVLTVQCLLTIVIATFALITDKQLRFINEQSLGFDKDRIVILPLFSDNFNTIIGQVTGDLRSRMNYFEQEALKNPAVEAITCSAFEPGEGGVSALTTTDSLTDRNSVFISLNSVDYDFLETYDIPIVAGRNFSRETGTDHLQAFIINEEAVKQLGFRQAEDAIGENLSAVGKSGKIIGIMKNFHFEGLQQKIQPLILEVSAAKFSSFSVRVNEKSKQQALSMLHQKWEEVFPETVFSYSFLDDDIESSYASDEGLSLIASGTATLAVILSLLGIFASTLNHANGKIKELTLRKALGATGIDLIITFARPFFGILLLSAALALPAAWVVSDQWLSGFAYKTNLSIVDGLIIVAMAFLLISIVMLYQLRRIISINPSKNLRAE